MYYKIDVSAKYKTDNIKLLTIIDYIDNFKILPDSPIRIKLVLDAAKQWVSLYKKQAITCTDTNIIDAITHFVIKLNDKLKMYNDIDNNYYSTYINVLSQKI